ncbi:MAG: hypothetical protein GXY38_08440 [Planctomycetes bacterium]|jgi:hypothetical protein|nr:hypothetical protein [Planctomycetota bacterium]
MIETQWPSRDHCLHRRYPDDEDKWVLLVLARVALSIHGGIRRSSMHPGHEERMDAHGMRIEGAMRRQARGRRGRGGRRWRLR